MCLSLQLLRLMKDKQMKIEGAKVKAFDSKRNYYLVGEVYAPAVYSEEVKVAVLPFHSREGPNLVQMSNFTAVCTQTLEVV